jgi:hypothetical protein
MSNMTTFIYVRFVMLLIRLCSPSYVWGLSCYSHVFVRPVICEGCHVTHTSLFAQLYMKVVMLITGLCSPSYIWRLSCYSHVFVRPVICEGCHVTHTSLFAQLYMKVVMLLTRLCLPSYMWGLSCYSHVFVRAVICEGCHVSEQRHVSNMTTFIYNWANKDVWVTWQPSHITVRTKTCE